VSRPKVVALDRASYTQTLDDTEDGMIIEYINAALASASYERLEDKDNPYYGEVPVLKGVWATGKTLEECRQHLAEVIEGWLIVRFRKGLAIPPIGKTRLQPARSLRFGT
jgi:predicted RNase H-like HicB family nuclease